MTFKRIAIVQFTIFIILLSLKSYSSDYRSRVIKTSLTCAEIGTSRHSLYKTPFREKSELACLEWAVWQSEKTLRRNSIAIDVKGLGVRKILVAGSDQFASLWTRDFGFASLGALLRGLSKPVKGGLEALFQFQRSDGLFPRRIGSISNVWRGLRDKLGLDSPINILKKAEFKSGLGGTPIDSNPLLAWVLENYIESTGDLEFAETKWLQMKRSFDWMQANEEQGLLVQTSYADWKDVTARNGKVMYSNVIYYRGLLAMKRIAEKVGDPIAAEEYKNRGLQLHSNIRKEFWNPRYGMYRDRVGDESDFFSADGNFLAVIFEIANKEESEKILSRADKLLRHKTLGLFANVDRAYSNSYVPFSVRIVGIKGYSDNTYIYPWNTALYVWAVLKNKNPKNQNRARLGLLAMIRSIKAHGFQEAYEVEGAPVERWAHASEPDFSWFAGMMALVGNQALKDELWKPSN